MTNLTKLNVKYAWIGKCHEVFELLKEKLTTAPILITPQWNKPFYVYCDASNDAIGNVLVQYILGVVDSLIYYTSCLLNQAEKN